MTIDIKEKNPISIFIIVTTLLVITFNLHYGIAQPVKKEEKKVSKDILSSKVVRKIYRRQGLRLDKINEYKKKSFIGENTNGLLSIRTTKELSQKEADHLNKLIALENKDREKIYTLIIKANSYKKEEEKTLRESMFKSRFDVDPIGTYFLQNTYWQKK